jgi:hypothetical protein
MQRSGTDGGPDTTQAVVIPVITLPSLHRLLDNWPSSLHLLTCTTVWQYMRTIRELYTPNIPRSRGFYPYSY